MKEIILTTGRLLITTVFLFVVWEHAHWSTWLAIVGLTINAELETYRITLLHRLLNQMRGR